MRPLFTIHAGEFLTAGYIEQRYRRLNVWVPAKDTGVDLLVSDSKNKKTVSLQVKFSKDFLATQMNIVFKERLRACGWWKFNRQKLVASAADYWVFVLVGFACQTTDFVIITPAELLRRLDAIHPGEPKTFQTYLWVTQHRKCWETRGLKRLDQLAIACGEYENIERDFTSYLEKWEPLGDLNR
jgi:hypothetical protein